MNKEIKAKWLYHSTKNAAIKIMTTAAANATANPHVVDVATVIKIMTTAAANATAPVRTKNRSMTDTA